MNPLYLSRPCVACFDNEPPASAPVPKPTPAPAPAAPKTITQDEFQAHSRRGSAETHGRTGAVEQMLQEVSESKNLTMRERGEQGRATVGGVASANTHEGGAVAHEKKQLEDQYQRKLREARTRPRSSRHAIVSLRSSVTCRMPPSAVMRSIPRR